MSPPHVNLQPAVIVHGGAWEIPQHMTEQSLSGVKDAASAAYAVLSSGGSAADAVEVAVMHMESVPVFDAGVGSCLTVDGTVEMDAAFMTDTPRLGAVAAVSTVEHPVSVARRLLDSHHCMLVGKGAENFAVEEGFPQIDPQLLITSTALKDLKGSTEYDSVVKSYFGNGHDTVGAVALDSNGHIACATSTGGITAKRVGRVGDSSLSGSGLYCRRNVGGVSATGHGESIMKTVICKHIIDLMSMCKHSVGNAAVEALQTMNDETNGCGGVVALDADGSWAAECTTSRMAWACVDVHQVLRGGIGKGEVLDFGKVTF